MSRTRLNHLKEHRPIEALCEEVWLPVGPVGVACLAVGSARCSRLPAYSSPPGSNTYNNSTHRHQNPSAYQSNLSPWSTVNPMSQDPSVSVVVYRESVFEVVRCVCLVLCSLSLLGQHTSTTTVQQAGIRLQPHSTHRSVHPSLPHNTPVCPFSCVPLSCERTLLFLSSSHCPPASNAAPDPGHRGSLGADTS